MIAIMLVSGGISQSASNLKKSLKMRETKFFFLITQGPTVIAIMLGFGDEVAKTDGILKFSKVVRPTGG